MPATPGVSAGAGSYCVKWGEEIALTIIREGKDLLDSFYRPSEDNFLRAPFGVAFVELLEGYWFFPFHVVLFVGSEEVVDGVKEMLHHFPSFCWPSLNYIDEII